MVTTINKSYHGWIARTVHGLTEVTTMKRHSGKIYSVKHILKAINGNMVEYSPFSPENQALKSIMHDGSSTEANIKACHSIALEHFYPKDDSLLKAIRSGDQSRVSELEKKANSGETICLIG